MLMQEIECTKQLMGGTLTKKDRKTYQSHLASLKRQLQSLTSGSAQRSDDETEDEDDGVLEMEEVMAPEKTKNMIAKMQKVVPQKVTAKVVPLQLVEEPQKSPRRGRSRSPGRGRSRSRDRRPSSQEPRQSSGATTTEHPRRRPSNGDGGGMKMREEAPEIRQDDIPQVVSFGKDIDNPVDDQSSVSILGVPTKMQRGSQKPQLVRIVAPANLPEGYQLEANMDDNKVVMVTVPAGGVKKGQVFASIATKPTGLEKSSMPLPPTTPTSKVPQQTATGMNPMMVDQQRSEPQSWKGSLFNCFAYGMGHPVFCHSFWLPQGTLYLLCSVSMRSFNLLSLSHLSFQLP